MSENDVQRQDMRPEYEFAVLVDDEWVAGGSAYDAEALLDEADTYAMAYEDDGKVTINFWIKHPLTREQMEAAIHLTEEKNHG